MRSGARPGDLIYVTGELGAGSAALHELLAGRPARPADFPRHFCPVPRVAIGKVLRAKGLATAMIDLSDGLSTDLAHVCDESRIGAKIFASSLPRARVGRKKQRVSLDLALHGGEDYELLFTAPRGKRLPSKIAGVPITCIGRVTRTRAILLTGENGSTKRLQAKGWEHFR